METDNTPGAEAQNQSINTPATDSAAEPTPIELRDDSLVKIPGSDKPTKYGEFYRGLQGQLTKASQRAAELERRYVEAQARLEERERAFQRMNSQPTPGQTTNPTAELVNKIRSLPYMSGEDAAEMTETIINQIAQVGGQFQQRDAILIGLARQLKATQDLVNNLQSNHVNSSFEGKITRWVGELGLPAEATDFAKELYLAYEGEGLDEEFPTILKNRWEQVVSLARQAERARIDSARKLPFVPGRGGQGVPSKPLSDKLAKANPAQVADELWEAMQVDAQ